MRYLNDREAIVDAIDYVQKNPIELGLKALHWNFVVPFDAPNDRGGTRRGRRG